MIIQSLVENAIKHGIATRKEGGRVSIQIESDNNTLHVTVTNDGTIRSPEGSAGLGLTNARERIRILYDERASLILNQTDSDTVVAELTIPIEGTSEDSDRR
jgi:LytS/YehU family sensor histidine kinase